MAGRAAVAVGALLIGGGVWWAIRDPKKVEASPGEAVKDAPKADPEEQAVKDAGEMVSVSKPLAPGESVPTGTAVTMSPAGKSVLVEPGFTIENSDGTKSCSDANGGPISCDDLAARIKKAAKINGDSVVF